MATRGGGSRRTRAVQAAAARRPAAGKADGYPVEVAPCRDRSPLPGSMGDLVIHETDENGGHLPALAASVNGCDVGWIIWSEDGTVAGVGVLPEYRHRGIATALWRAAQQRCPALRHDGKHITADGLAFANAVSGPWSTGTAPRRATIDLP